jgi:hypothetical protein
MGLALLIFRPDGTADVAAELRAAVRDAVWQVADAHWALGEDCTLISCDLSPDYLVDHFRRALSRRGEPWSGPLLVTAVGPRTAWAGLPADAEGWLRDMLA